MLWFKRMPNVALTRYSDSQAYDVVLARAFRRGGKLWCVWRSQYVLLKNDGTCVGDTNFPMTWEVI